MGNHVHLLIMKCEEALETVMRRICCSFVLWYNKKHDRVGYLIKNYNLNKENNDECLVLFCFQIYH